MTMESARMTDMRAVKATIGDRHQHEYPESGISALRLWGGHKLVIKRMI